MRFDMVSKNNSGPDGYFYANSWTMIALCEVLFRLGAIDRESAPATAPTPPNKEVSKNDPQWDEYWRQCRAVLAKGSEYPGKVPLFKFESNDGWHVVPAECAILAEALHRCDRDSVSAIIKTLSEHLAPLMVVKPLLKPGGKIVESIDPRGSRRILRLIPKDVCCDDERDIEFWWAIITKFAEFCEGRAGAGGFFVT